MKISIIGASENLDDLYDKKKYLNFIDKIENYIISISNGKWNKIKLISGGSSFSDHIAIEISLRHPDLKRLKLYLPCDWDGDQFDNNQKEGFILNNLHKKFSKIIEKNSLEDIKKVSKLSNTKIKIYRGFLNRNKYVSKTDYLIAISYGIDKPNKGGTYHTWKLSKNSENPEGFDRRFFEKIHFSIVD